MVRLKDDGCFTAKIIDLGLAKKVSEPGARSAISTPGAFAGTPEFASPEQFAGVEVDIRSDLYSLGVVLWEMVVGQTPFQGLPSELMHQHRHARLPREQLKSIPQPVIVLLEMLLEKDPRQRFQSPTDLLKAIPEIAHASAAKRRLTRQSLEKILAGDAHAVVHKPSTRPRPKKLSLARLPVTGTNLFGREEDIAFLDAAWASEQVNIVTIVAWAGVGNRRWLTIGSGGWRLIIIVQPKLCSVGLSIDRGRAEALPPQTNLSTVP
jgi:serine/threonine protein kinase